MATFLSPLKLLNHWTSNSTPGPLPSSYCEQGNRHCDSRFLEGLVSRLDVPLLEKMQIQILRNDGPVPNISELPQFISRIETFKTFDKTDVHIHHEDIQFLFSSQTSSVASAEFSLTFVLMGSLKDLIPDVCSSLPPLTRFKCLTLREHRYRRKGIGNTPLQEILCSFTTVTKYIHIQIHGGKCIACMEGLSEERATAMLPVAAKGLAGHPVTLHRWEVDE